jgi:Ca-activated chloride channel homolog
MASLDELEPMPLRKVILLFSDGDDTASKARLRAVINRARAADVMIYAIGLEAREFDGDEFVDVMPSFVLRRIASDSGGGYFELESSTDLGPTFNRIAEELHSQYMLAFAPTSSDGHVHKIAVRPKNQAFRVRARRSYVASRGPRPR